MVLRRSGCPADELRRPLARRIPRALEWLERVPVDMVTAEAVLAGEPLQRFDSVNEVADLRARCDAVNVGNSLSGVQTGRYYDGSMLPEDPVADSRREAWYLCIASLPFATSNSMRSPRASISFLMVAIASSTSSSHRLCSSIRPVVYSSATTGNSRISRMALTSRAFSSSKVSIPYLRRPSPSASRIEPRRHPHDNLPSLK